MKRLFQIEFAKVKNTSYFWIFTILFLLFLLSIPIGSKYAIAKMAENTMDLNGIDLYRLPLFDFVDIWQNLTWVYKFGAIIISFIIVISVANEYRYGTAKQNVIDGLSRKEFLLSKITLILFLSAIISVGVLLIGLIMGFSWSAVIEFKYIIRNIEFVAAYFVVLVGTQIFAMLITLIIRKPGIVILMLLFYFFFIEGLAYVFIKYKYELPLVSNLLPLRGMSEIISNPMPKYWFREVYTNIQFKHVLFTLGHIGLYTYLCFRYFLKKDIR
ncbi:MAG: hypothetical protein AAF487_06685 [Bacteroidota bacterium]